MKYNLSFTEVCRYETIIEADSIEEAKAILGEEYHQDGWILRDTDFYIDHVGILED